MCCSYRSDKEAELDHFEDNRSCLSNNKIEKKKHLWLEKNYDSTSKTKKCRNTLIDRCLALSFAHPLEGIWKRYQTSHISSLLIG